MVETFEITCPGCKDILIVDRKTGKVLEVRKPLLDESSGDRFEDARQRVLSSKERAEEKFEKAKQKEKEKFAKLDALFNEKKEELKDKPIERPDRPWDMD